MRKKILAVILVLVTLLGVIPAYAEDGIFVYLSISRYGEVVEDKDSNSMAYVSVELSGKDSYTIDDAFKKVHELYYEDGVNGYASSEGEYGLGIDKLWGDTSYNFGYWVNGEMAMGAGDLVEGGDYIDAFIYQNSYPDTESYATFDKQRIDSKEGETVELTLTYVSGYDDSWNCVFSPCDGAVITINGEESEYQTDENGKAYIEFDEPGVKILSAKKEKTLNDESVPAITAPVCVVDVKPNLPIQIIHNLAAKYAEMAFEDAGGNLPWIIADMMAYEEVFGKDVISDSDESEALSLIVDGALDSQKPGDLAKAIIAIRALGYDAENIITSEYNKEDLVKKLTDMIDSADEAVTNIYTLPYVIIALSQSEDYASQKQMDYLLSSALGSKESWQITDYGTDAMTPMVLALSQFYNENDEVKTVIDETVEIIKAEQRDDGLIDGAEGYESASTALAICAFSALGIDPDTVKNGELSLIDGLMSTVNSELNSFPNAFADEQGFRGLLAWQMLLKNTGKVMYDFSDYPLKKVNLAGITNCPVVFEITPSKAEVAVSGETKFSDNCFDLDAGSYEYIVTASGYKASSGRIEVSDDEAENNIRKVITVNLSRSSSGGSGGSSGFNPVNQEEKPVVEEEKEDVEETKKEFNENTFSDVDDGDWYYSAVKYAYENDLFSGTDKGFEPDRAMTRAMLVSVLHRLSGSEEVTDDNPFDDIGDDKWYAKSIKWAAANGIVSGITDTEFAPDNNITREQLATIIYRYATKFGYDLSLGNNTDISTFTDGNIISSYALDAVKFVVGAKVMTGRDYDEFCPGEIASRAEVASMLMRFAGIGAK